MLRLHSEDGHGPAQAAREVPPMTMLESSILDLFERAFGRRRPTATDWRSALDAAMNRLVRCKNDPRHSYMADAGRCPWCEMIATKRVMFFLPAQGAAATSFRPEDIQQLIRKLTALGLSFAPYSRPKASLPIRVSLPAGLRSPTPKPATIPLPSPPSLASRPAIKPLPPAPAAPPRPELKLVPNLRFTRFARLCHRRAPQTIFSAGSASSG